MSEDSREDSADDPRSKVELLRRLRDERADREHRARNMLAVIRSITRRMIETAETVEDFGMHLEGRLDAIGRWQARSIDHLSRGVSLDLLIADELLAYKVREGHQFDMDGPPVSLRKQAVGSLTLAFHELSTNAIKFGALSVPQGHVAISWNMIVSAEADKLEIIWVESGGPQILAVPKRYGLGSDVLLRSLNYDLGATTKLMYEPLGLRCEILLPLDVICERRLS